MVSAVQHSLDKPNSRYAIAGIWVRRPIVEYSPSEPFQLTFIGIGIAEGGTYCHRIPFGEDRYLASPTEERKQRSHSNVAGFAIDI